MLEAIVLIIIAAFATLGIIVFTDCAWKAFDKAKESNEKQREAMADAMMVYTKQGELKKMSELTNEELEEIYKKYTL